MIDKAHSDKPLTYEQFLQKLHSNEEFIDDFIDVLRRGLQSFSDMDMTPYFFETPPVSLETLNSTDFEFVLVAAWELKEATAAPEYEKITDMPPDARELILIAFAETFKSISKDAMMGWCPSTTWARTHF